MHHDGWAELVNDEEHGGSLIPMMMLCHEHDEDPEMHVAAGLLGVYGYFRAHRQVSPGAHRSEPTRTAPKIGRNDACLAARGRSTSVAAARRR